MTSDSDGSGGVVDFCFGVSLSVCGFFLLGFLPAFYFLPEDAMCNFLRCTANLSATFACDSFMLNYFFHYTM